MDEAPPGLGCRSPGTRLVVAMAPEFTIGLVRPSLAPLDRLQGVERQAGGVDPEPAARLLGAQLLADQGEDERLGDAHDREADGRSRRRHRRRHSCRPRTGRTAPAAPPPGRGRRRRCGRRATSRNRAYASSTRSRTRFGGGRCAGRDVVVLGLDRLAVPRVRSQAPDQRARGRRRRCRTRSSAAAPASSSRRSDSRPGPSPSGSPGSRPASGRMPPPRPPRSSAPAAARCRAGVRRGDRDRDDDQGGRRVADQLAQDPGEQEQAGQQRVGAGIADEPHQRSRRASPRHRSDTSRSTAASWRRS